MNTCKIGRALSVALLAAVTAPAETLHEEDGVRLEGSVRLVGSAAATCEAGPDADEATRANAGQPLHVWRLDYAVYNGSGRGLSQVAAHVRIESEWPPCSSWDGPEGSYPGPLEWAGSFKTLQRTGGLAPGEDAGETVYVLAFHDRQPRFAKWQLKYRFGEPSGAPEATPAPAGSHSASEASAVPQPVCEFSSDGGMKGLCWTELDSHPGCYVLGEHLLSLSLTWNGSCDGTVASGLGTLALEWQALETSAVFEFQGLMRDGKRTGHWIERYGYAVYEGPYVDSERHGRWVESLDDGRTNEGLYFRGKKHGRWVHHWSSGSVHEGTFVHGRKQGPWTFRTPDGKEHVRRWENNRPVPGDDEDEEP